MRTAERVVVAAVLGTLVACSGRSSPRMDLPAGGSSPEQAVEAFLSAAQEGVTARRAGEATDADRAYARMAAVFGTQSGSINRAYPADEVRSRMIVLSTCLRPEGFRIISTPDPQAWSSGRTTVTAELRRGSEALSLPFQLVKGRDDRWFIEQIDLSSSFAC